MISRYTLPEMGSIWTEQNKVQKWLDVELAALEGLARFGFIPKSVPPQVRKRAAFDLKRIHDIEKIVNHDVIAFLTNLAENVGPVGRYVHFGLTSSDILDTALALQLTEAADLILKELHAFKQALKKQARKHKNTLMVGRSHGIHAEPMTFGLKLALFYEEMSRCERRLKAARENIAYGKISGAVGTFANVDPRVEADVCRRLGLKADPISTQVIQRDRHAEFLSALAILGGCLEQLATEIRLLQKTETREVEEFFGKGQKGSSAMPHKRNPITCERVAGLSRLLRANAHAAIENIALWHERDITHSSVERVIFPDSTILAHYMLVQMRCVIENLLVYPEKMLQDLEITRGMVFSQGLLLKLVEAGKTREDSYALVQRCAMKVWEDSALTLRDVVLSDAEIVKALGAREIEKVFDYNYHVKHVGTLFKRVGL